jgi:superfamily II DNA or RNA helicase
MARPTKSQTLYIQSVGRGLRKHPGKENCLLLDFTDKGHSLDSIMQLNCILPEATFLMDEEAEETEDEEELEEVDRTPKMGAVKTSDRAFDIVGASRFCWVKVGGGVWSLLDDDNNEIVMTPTTEGTYTATVFHPDGTSKTIVNTPIPLDYCSGVSEDYARRNLKVSLADRSKAWLKSDSPITNSQRSFLQKEGVLVDGLSKAEAAIEIRRVIGLKNQRRRLMSSEPITSKQAYFLRSQGIDPKGMTKLDGMCAIAKMKTTTGNK